MYARVITVPIKPGAIDEAVSNYEIFVAPVAREQPGFKGATLLVNTNANTAVSTTFWETKADMLVGEASGYLQSALTKLTPFFAGTPTKAHYEVRVQI